VNTSNTPWIPYKIPPTPVPKEGVQYALSFANNATPTKNPSQFLEWQEVTFPQGTQKWDLLYWDPASGENGAWVPLKVQGTAENPLSLTYNGNSLIWSQTSSIPNADQGDILYWSGSASDGKWSVLSAPSVDGISVLIHTNGVPQWARTASCN